MLEKAKVNETRHLGELTKVKLQLILDGIALRLSGLIIWIVLQFIEVLVCCSGQLKDRIEKEIF